MSTNESAYAIRLHYRLAHLSLAVFVWMVKWATWLMLERASPRKPYVAIDCKSSNFFNFDVVNRSQTMRKSSLRMPVPLSRIYRFKRKNWISFAINRLSAQKLPVDTWDHRISQWFGCLSISRPGCREVNNIRLINISLESHQVTCFQSFPSAHLRAAE